jgi:hypothetical protein
MFHEKPSSELGVPPLQETSISLFLALKLDVWQMGRSNLTWSKVSLATNQNDMLVKYDHRGAIITWELLSSCLGLQCLQVKS